MADDDQEQGATGRRWRVSLPLTILGVLILIVGLVLQYLAAIAAGLVLVVYFGPIAAGARKSQVGSDLVKGAADFDAPAPPQPSDRRRIYLPTGWRSRSKKKK